MDGQDRVIAYYFFVPNYTFYRYNARAKSRIETNGIGPLFESDIEVGLSVIAVFDLGKI